jgi:F-type H+-transporting ATPase subunit b
MRHTRQLLAGLFLVVGVLSVAGAAGAATDTPAKATPTAECSRKAVESGKTGDAFNTAIEDCAKAENPLVPAKNELIWGTLGFLVVFGFLYAKGYPAIKKGMNDRTEKIRGDIDAAETQKAEASTVLAEYRAQLADAKSEGARIIEEARQTADSLKRDLQTQAEADIADLRAKNVADIEAAKVQAIADLRNEVASIAIGAAERVVERNLDQATNTALVESFISQVGAGK